MREVLKRLLAWWHELRGFHAGPATYFAQQGSESYISQRCSCGATKDTIVENNMIGKSIVEYIYRWKAKQQ